ncbi:MAG: DUF4105 domain-containing protein [Flavobacteriales bacterium]|jgi:hypothetical protein|nr:DUF4105 domain-containing protein [Flavobacteriales bacterium]
MKYILLSIGLFFLFQINYSQRLSQGTVISVITCDEGDEIYSLFGHSALRVKDVRNHIDFVYNWGMFEFGSDELDFQYRFAKGKLKYYMAEELFENFMYTYQLEERTVREQILNLTYKQKIQLWNAIQENYKPENRYYRYDFFFDNCSTRIGELLKNALGESLNSSELPEANRYTYRQLIDKQVHTSQPWSDFGIDLALGKKIDKITTSEEMQFLPKYLEQFLALSKIQTTTGEQNLVAREKVLLVGKSRVSSTYDGWAPSTITWGVFFLVLVIHLINKRVLSLSLDVMMLLLFGILGGVVLFLWLGTDHEPTKSNFNLLWANPIHLVTIVLLLFKKKLLNKYALFMAFYSFAIILFWIALPQEFNEAVRPLILIQVLIYYYLYSSTKALSLDSE